LRPALMPFSSSIKPDGTAQKPSVFQATSRSCRCRRARPSSTAKRTSGRPYVRPGAEVACPRYATSEGCVGWAGAEPHAQGTNHATKSQGLCRS
jgi:hypothetical protein